MAASSNLARIGVTGLGVMGRNLARNLARHGYPVAVHNRTWARTEALISEHGDEGTFVPSRSTEDFVASLARPRTVVIMVKAGTATDAVIDELVPLLEAGDIVVDAGNAHFPDTIRREAALRDKGLHFVGCGVSGGEEGALNGPSIMPGGSAESYATLGPMLEEISAHVDGVPCCTHVGPDGAGHFVKMVHNGIEYGIMQLIAEAYDVLHRGAGIDYPTLHQAFTEWNNAELNSYLIEITADILGTVDPDTGKPIADVILDEAKQKGTGKWTSQNALDLGIPTHTINAAVEARVISALKDQRVAASEVFSGPDIQFNGSKDELIAQMRAALYAAILTSYAQGIALIEAASEEYDYNLNLEDIARIWRGGCIIRASLLEDIRKAYANESPANMMVAEPFRTQIEERQAAWRSVIQTAVGLGIPVPGLAASLAYFDAYRTGRLPANLTQAQRDYFGSHTYRRTDKDGIFHTEWED